MDFELAFTNKEIAHSSVMALMKCKLDHLGFAEALIEIQLPVRQTGWSEGVWDKTKTFAQLANYTCVFAS
jgi:hypothetical protein